MNEWTTRALLREADRKGPQAALRDLQAGSVRVEGGNDVDGCMPTEPPTQSAPYLLCNLVQVVIVKVLRWVPVLLPRGTAPLLRHAAWAACRRATSAADTGRILVAGTHAACCHAA
eukprot:194960-Chlamydomonas_euryale.AAC.13